MNAMFQLYGRTDWKRLKARRAAWQAHYEAKGCHPIKAAQVAFDKCRRSSTWPNGAPR